MPRLSRQWLPLVLVLLGLTFPSRVLPAADPAPRERTVSEPDRFLVGITVENQKRLNAIAGELDIWEVHPDRQQIVAAVRPEQYAWLESLGYQMERAEGREASAIQSALDPRYYYFDDSETNVQGRYVVDFLQAVHAAYPHLTELQDIGDGWLADQPDGHSRDILVLRISNEDPALGSIADKPAFFLLATIHAREVVAPELAIRYIAYLTAGYDGEGGYGRDPDVTWLVDHHVAYVLVMHNPDGHWVNEQDIGNYRRKNMDSDDGCAVPSLWGVDLNRNHSFMWGCCGGSSGDACSDTYRGPSAASEPETQAFQTHFSGVMEDQNGPNGDNEIPAAAPDDTKGIFVTLHSYGDIVIWPWSLDPYPDPPNASELEAIGRKLAVFNGYDPAGSIWYAVDGATDDWVYGKFGIPAFTFEVGSDSGACAGFFPPYGCVEGMDSMPRNFWAENNPAFLYAHKIAAAPYRAVYGPDTLDVAVSPVFPGDQDTVLLSATIADRRYPGDGVKPVGAAEYFVDAPGADGSGIPMTPLDGAWDKAEEDVTAVVDTKGLGPGRHSVLVHGQNSDGDWGPYSAVFVRSGEALFLPLIMH